MRTCVLILSIVVGTTPLWAQGTHPTRAPIVAQAKADLEAAGTTLTTPCGAFSIVELATWRMREEQAGLLEKPGGNNCRGFAVDIVVYPDGEIYDVLIAQTVKNIPAWQVPGAGVVDPSRYRPAHDPEFDAVPIPPTPPATPDQLTRIETKVDALAVSLEEHRAASRSLVSRALGFARDPRTITMVLGILAGRYVVPGGN